MAITATQVKELRDKTGAGMMDCKKALEASNGELDAAVKYLREKGMLKAAKRSERSTEQGIIKAIITDTVAAILELNCETDFVARTDEFIALTETTLKTILTDYTDKNGNVELPESITAAVTDIIAKIGENIKVRRFAVLNSNTGATAVYNDHEPDTRDSLGHNTLVCYNHFNGKVSALVEITTDSDLSTHDVFKNFVTMMSQQVAASGPKYLTPDDVPEAILSHEKEIYREEAKNAGKPDAILDKIAEGKINKFYAEVCLMNMPYIENEKISVSQHCEALSKELGAQITIRRFIRYFLGEELGK